MTTTKKISELVSTSLTTLISINDKVVTKQVLANNSSNTGVIVGVTIASILILIILIYAIYKYRNRDEGTYTIDETKNFGPFADLDVNNSCLNEDEKTSSLNCVKKGSKGVKKAAFNGNKEWYV